MIKYALMNVNGQYLKKFVGPKNFTNDIDDAQLSESLSFIRGYGMYKGLSIIKVTFEPVKIEKLQ